MKILLKKENFKLRLVIFFLIIGLIGSMAFYQRYIKTYATFEPKVWDNVRAVNRLKMAEDLITRKVLIGKTKEEVKIILGKNGLVIESEETLEYIVGFNTIDPWVLRIRFDEKNKVYSAGIYDG